VTDRRKAWQVGWFGWKASGGFPYIDSFFLEEAFIIAKRRFIIAKRHYNCEEAL